MSRPCPEAAAVGAALLATTAAAVAALRQHLADPDPKTALRAVAELTKLLNVCARHGLAVGAAEEVVPPPVLAPAPGGSARVADSRRESEETKESLSARATHPQEMSLPAVATHPHGTGPQALPPGGRRLTSFLGRPDPVSQSHRPTAPPPPENAR